MLYTKSRKLQIDPAMFVNTAHIFYRLMHKLNMYSFQTIKKGIFSKNILVLIQISSL